jgi:hypothetical protein
VAVATTWEEEGVEVEDPAGDGNRTRMEEAEAVEAAEMEPVDGASAVNDRRDHR